MEKISSNPYFNPAQIYQHPKVRMQALRQQMTQTTEVEKTESAKPTPPDYSSLFGDEELSKLQANLEAISKLAENALKRIDKE